MKKRLVGLVHVDVETSKEYRRKGNEKLVLLSPCPSGVCWGKEQGSEQEGKAPSLRTLLSLWLGDSME